MFCNNCGTQVPENEKFCTNCGAALTASDESVNVVNAAPSNKLYDIIALGGMALMILATLLPCYTVSFLGLTESFSYIQGDGIFVLLSAIVAFILFWRNLDKFMAIPAAVSAICLIVFLSQSAKVGIGSFAIGYYLMWLATIVVAVVPFTPLAKGKSLFKK